MTVLKRRREADLPDAAATRVLEFASLTTKVEVFSPIHTPELDFDSLTSFDSASSPDDASDLFDFFTPPLSTVEDSPSIIFAADSKKLPVEPSASTIVIHEDDGEDATTDDEEIPIIKTVSAPRSTAASVVPASSMGPPPLPLGIHAMGPVIGHWTDKTPAKPVTGNVVRQRSESSILPNQQRLPISSPTSHAISHAVASSVSSSVDALLEQYVDVTNVVDNTLAPLPGTKSWIDRYMTIPICGYLNRASVESDNEVAVAATTVAGISKPPGSSSTKKRKASSSLKPAGSAPAVYGFKRRSLFAGKGSEMVGLGVMVGDLLL
ncbi:hypothetical protein V1525DRAFT_414467 [Lipomyces kononenkoae]|uniref:Uncharacterized protein n=1 Tax=Lipomyces kononenkoae TaxID=34357 RepID=A0ACC3SQW3_LIPKO